MLVLDHTHESSIVAATPTVSVTRHLRNPLSIGESRRRIKTGGAIRGVPVRSIRKSLTRRNARILRSLGFSVAY